MRIVFRIKTVGAPSCLVVLKERLAEGQFGQIPSWLTGLGRVASEGNELGLVIEGSAAALGRDPQQGQSRVSLRPAVPPAEDLEPGRDSLANCIKRASGWTLAQYIKVCALNPAPANHQLVGRIARELAERCNGLIRLREVCIPDDDELPSQMSPEAQARLSRFASRIHPEDRDLPEGLLSAASKSGDLLEPVLSEQRHRLEEGVRRKAARFPGTFYELVRPEGEVDSYLVDAVFMAAWLADPLFYIG